MAIFSMALIFGMPKLMENSTFVGRNWDQNVLIGYSGSRDEGRVRADAEGRCAGLGRDKYGTADSEFRSCVVDGGEDDRLGREMECKWKLVMTNQNSVASAGLDSA